MKPIRVRLMTFVAGPASGMVLCRDLVSIHPVPSRCYLTQGTRWGHQCPMDNFLF